MKVEINRESLETALVRSCSVVASKVGLPILFENLFKFSAGKLEITASNLEITMIVTTSYDLKEGEDVNVVVEGSSILRVISLLKSENIFFEVTTKEKSKPSKVIFGSTKGRKRYELPVTYTTESFPKIEDVELSEMEEEGISVPGDVLNGSLKVTSPIANPSDLRPSFQGVFFGVVKGKLRTAAVDHMSIAVTEFPIKEDGKIEPVIINKNSATLLAVFEKSMTVNVIVSKISKKIVFFDGAIKVYCTLIDAPFPDIDKIIKNVDTSSMFLCDKTDMIQSIKRSLVMSSKATQALKVEVEGKSLIMSAEDIDYSRNSIEEIDLIETSPELKLTAGINGNIIGKFMNNLESENVIVYCKDHKTPFLFTNNKHDKLSVRFLVSPILLKS